jgi:DNA invertase Pin-like site-specific DNA recombinase
MKIYKSPPGDQHVAIALVRVSTEDQRLGPEAQRGAIVAWAQRQRVEVIAWHLEQGVSGATPIEDRAILLSALADLKTYGAGRLVVAKRDRLARDVMFCALIERLVERNGACVCSADGTGEAGGPEGVLMRGMIDLFAQYERLLIASRTRAALAAKKARGERTGQVPYGFALAPDRRTLVANETERATMAVVHELRTSGLAIRKIVVECARLGLVSRTGRVLGKTQVERILRRDAPETIRTEVACR